MKRELVYTTGFNRDARRWAKKHPTTKPDIVATLAELEADAFHPALRAHKLSGKLSACWACSAGYDIRIVFEFIAHDGAEAIRLFALGTHDDVYN